MVLPALLALLSAAAAVSTSPHFDVTAAFVAPGKPGAAAAVAVTFLPRDPDVSVTRVPAPRLQLEALQGVLVQPAKAGGKPAAPPAPEGKYLDPGVPYRFPVALAPQAPKGPQTVKGTVTYFYCSKREGWCRRGTADVEVAVNVP